MKNQIHLELLKSKRMMLLLIFLESNKNLYMTQIGRMNNLCSKHNYDLFYNLQRLGLVYIKRSEKYKGNKDNRRKYFELTELGKIISKSLRKIISLLPPENYKKGL